ncbi:hypothetical protein HBI56_233480 [Parastagonospora nodorum]|nr:hypothetical protein HBH53_075330 [Parastagonospora nodorum]KAH3998600.1 hypothetical protein HBI10_123450 [Parastagonospora nodorum]KAH4008134.1 hypothetical protein HBI13_241540 [Parastagonospora nodorum]KAH4333560.1 hypothetical protein HBH98_246630 [Parastagonospora nodorum]KAH4383770.1 hypothetical protein HBH99_183450 [Parastagonospora nodorum]
MLFSNTLIACLAGSLAAAAPATHCNDMIERHVTLVEQVTGWTFPVSGAGCNAGSTNCVISAGKTYAVSKSISIGFGLDAGLGDVVRRELAKSGAGASFSFGYSFSESYATSVTVSGTCPKHHEYQQQATAQMLHVKGMQTTYSCYNGELEAPVTQDFEVFYPVTYAGSAQDSEAVITYSI